MASSGIISWMGHRPVERLEDKGCGGSHCMCIGKRSSAAEPGTISSGKKIPGHDLAEEETAEE